MRIDNFTAQDLIDREGYVRKGYKGNLTIKALCEDLLQSRKENPPIWKDAPEDAVTAHVHFLRRDASETGIIKAYHRELPKSKEEVLAEKLIKEWHSQEIASDENLKKRIVVLLKENK